jgi:hypothetical protein
MSALPSTSPPELLIGMIADPLAWAFWPAAKAMLTPALVQGDEEWPDVERELGTEARQLWAVVESGFLSATMITRIAQTNRGEVVEIFLVGGEGYPRWLAALNDQVEASAREIGCVGMRAWGRAGWSKPLRALGWKVETVAYEKALT